MKIAIVIPHKGREEMLKQTLDSIAAQEYDLNLVEVFVASQNDKPIDTTAYRNSLPNIKATVCDPSVTISALRNIGASSTSSEYIAFLDADVQLSPNWLSAMQNYLESDDRRVIASAIQSCSPEATPLEKIRTQLSNAKVDCSVEFLPGRNLFLKRGDFEQIGGFPEHLTTCEDYYFTGQANALGDLFYGTNADYVHLGEDKHLGEMFKKEIWRGRSNLLSLKGREIPLREIPSFVVPVWMLIFSILAIAGVVTTNLELMIGCICLVILPVGIYSFRLYSLNKEELVLKEVFLFYLTYFPARIIGTIAGIKDMVRN